MKMNHKEELVSETSFGELKKFSKLVLVPFGGLFLSRLEKKSYAGNTETVGKARKKMRVFILVAFLIFGLGVLLFQKNLPMNNRISNYINCEEIELVETAYYKISVNTDAKVSYKSENENIATVSRKGAVTGIKKGKTAIIVKIGNEEKKIPVTVSGRQTKNKKKKKK